MYSFAPTSSTQTRSNLADTNDENNVGHSILTQPSFIFDLCQSDQRLLQLLNVISTFRDQIRDSARSRSTDTSKEILQLCDFLRDTTLPDLGVLLEDKEGAGRSLIKLSTKQELLQLKETRRVKEQEKSTLKKENELKVQEKRMQKLEKGRKSPTELFKTEAFSLWDSSVCVLNF